MWKLVFECSELQRRLIALFVESCKNGNDSFNRIYRVIKRNEARWNRRFDKAVAV